MELPSVINNDPSALLFDEIEILLAQIRLMELYLKQARAAASMEAAQFHNRYQSELRALRTELEQKECALRTHAVTVGAVEFDWRAQIGDLENELERQRDLLSGRDGELAKLRLQLDGKERSLADAQARLAALEDEQGAWGEALQAKLAQSDVLLACKNREIELLRSEHTALRDRIAQLKAEGREIEAWASRETEALRLGLETENHELRARLAAREHFVAEQNSVLERHAAEIAALRARLAERENLVEQRAGELAQAQLEIAALREQSAQLDLLQKQTDRLLAAQAEQLRHRVCAELATLDARLIEKERELQAARDSAAESQASYHAKIDRLQIELAEKQLLVEGREREISDLKEQSRNLLERLAALESSNQHAQAAAHEDDHKRETLNRTLSDLRNELQEKEWALAQLQATIENLAQAHKTQIQTLEAKLADLRRAAESSSLAMDQAATERRRLLSRVEQAETAAAHAEATAMSRVEQITQLYETQIAALRNELEQKCDALAPRGVEGCGPDAPGQT